MDDPWGPIAIEDWRETLFTSGRPATETDVQAGRAVFVIPSGGHPHAISLPRLAIHHDTDTGAETQVIVIQAEEAGGEIIAGVRFLQGGNMVCTLGELRFPLD